MPEIGLLSAQSSLTVKNHFHRPCFMQEKTEVSEGSSDSPKVAHLVKVDLTSCPSPNSTGTQSGTPLTAPPQRPGGGAICPQMPWAPEKPGQSGESPEGGRCWGREGTGREEPAVTQQSRIRIFQLRER